MHDMTALTIEKAPAGQKGWTGPTCLSPDNRHESGAGGAVPLVAAYDTNECTRNPPSPLLFQRVIALGNRPIPTAGIRGLLNGALAASGITGTDGKPLAFRPHDFRRVFTTSFNGMPPHIAQLIFGHDDINTTMGRLRRRSHQRPPGLHHPPPPAPPQRGIPHPTDVR
jgi:Phage integrase family